MNGGGGQPVPDEAVDALVDAAAAGVDWARLTAARVDGAYRIAAGGTEHSGLSERAFRDAARELGAHVAEWYVWTSAAPESPPDRAFLRWVESADDRDHAAHRRALGNGVARTWGQLRLTAELGEDGHRRYGVRHEADAGRSLTALTVHDEPGALQDVVRHDDRSRYRPLKTAPTLPTGWALSGLDPSGLVAAVETCYPATIANWHREREGDLDVTHWRETAERQTGIYDVVDELTGERVEWLAGACCVDSQCLKRREWDETADEELDVPRGDGEFPCREPCSLVIAAAREFVLADRDAGEPISVDLTEGDLAQLERIVEAVAEGETDEIRDGDLEDGANRLRVRYLREKLSDDGGLRPSNEAGQAGRSGDRE